MGTPTERIAELEAMNMQLQNEVWNSHALIAIMAARVPGGVVITDAQMLTSPLLGQLTIHRDESIPGCVIMLRQPQQQQ